MRSSRPHHFDERPDASGAARRCTRTGCPQPAIATLTYVYAASTAVLGPLAVAAEPHTYDLCDAHARSLTAPRGWELVRHDGALTPPAPRPDDLAALAEAVWGTRGPSVAGAGTQPAGKPETGAPETGDPVGQPAPEPRGGGRRSGRVRGNLRLLPPD